MSEHLIQNPETYFNAFIPPRDALLTELEEQARSEQIPIIGPVVGQLLFILATAAKAKQILELGTAIAYSTIWLARACESTGGHVLTLESNPELAERAKSNLHRAGLSQRARIKVGDAIEEMAAIKEHFDFIFLDIDKQYYLSALNSCSRLLKKGGLLIADNTGFKDADDFNQTIASHSAWKIVQLYAFLPAHSPEKDGLCVALRV
jgi:predicted O-methyltransferase YrrM